MGARAGETGEERQRVVSGHTVQLRNGSFAEVTRNTRAAGFRVHGCTRDGAPQLWNQCGHWREDHKPHALDIVAIITADGVAVDITAAQYPK